ncbi:MAG TPA: FAD-linked oxidase C-terminal domain-containing protein [Candidatus Baltobacteraceae bacterium]|nr:FAD-linked oxidase C-terminal domain-containing protein [Candidatus Baltobacteraceae bacterium]
MLVARLIESLGPDAVKTEAEDLAVYAFDAYSQGRLPDAVVLPSSTRDVAAAVKIARDCEVPIVPRGAGTGLCGGAIPAAGGVVFSFARMNRILELDVPNRRARVQPGLVNLELSQRIAHTGLFYAPDPSSQRASTIGGNIGTNAGGPHCLSYGTTVNHVLGLEIVDEYGEVFHTWVEESGYDLTGPLVGSEGTLGITCSAWVRLMRTPEAVRVWLAAFPDVESASAAVSAIIGAGIVPTALEMLDRLAIQAVEAAFACGYPADAGAVLLIESAGHEDDLQAYEALVGRVVRENGAQSWRAARSQAERDALWAGRKGALGATGRIAPNYYIQDVVVPRTKLPTALKAVDAACASRNIKVANVFHAGDGNLHPLLLYDRSDTKQVGAVIDAGNEILQAAVDLGGTISGEHGIGFEKRGTLTRVFTTEDLAAMARVREVFDPKCMLNPEKIFPAGVGCGEIR